MLEVLSGFVAELRAAGLPVSLTEQLDAARAVHHVPLEDRAALKAALGATLVKSSAHLDVFDTAFEVYFAQRARLSATGDGPAAGPQGADGRGGTSDAGGRLEGAGGNEPVSAEALAALLVRALQTGDAGLLGTVAKHAVDRYGGVEAGRPVAGTYYLYRTLRRLDAEGVLARLVDALRESRGTEGGTALEERLATDEYRARIAALRRAVEAEIRRRLVEDRGPVALVRAVRRPLPEDVDVMHASREELARLSRALQPLSRKLAVRLGRKRRHRRRGPLDFRATVRHSLSTGGVPVEPRFRRPSPAKPEIVVIADISGSVASFARFTLQLVHAISAQFSKVRSFVFVDGIDEVTAFFGSGVDPGQAVQRITAEADVVRMDGHSDYGRALGEFLSRWGDAVTARTTVLVLGDARNNYHASGAWAMEELRRRARHLYWLNPEPRQYWGSGDSIVDEYALHCDAVVECRTLRQLERFVEDLG